MAGPIEEFFNGLHQRRMDVLPPDASGTLRFDLATDGGLDRWFLSVNDQNVWTSHEGEHAEEPTVDCVVTAERAAFERMVTGEMRPAPAVLRNELSTQGRVPLFIYFLRLMPGPRNARHPRAMVGADRRQP